MQTKTNLLPAINSLYSLDLSEEQLSRLLNLETTYGLKPVDEDDDDYKDHFKSLRYIEATDSIICVASLDSNTVNIHQLPDPDDEHARSIRVNEEICKTNLKSGWVYQTKDRGYHRSDLFNKDSNLHGFKSMTQTDQKVLKEYFRLLRSSVIEGRQTTMIFNNVTEARDSLVSQFMDNGDTLNVRGRRDCYLESEEADYIKAKAKHWWPQMVITQQPMRTIDAKLEESLTAISEMKMITFVGEIDNKRLVILEGHHNRRDSGSYYSSTNDIELFILPHNHEAYNYADVGRVVYKPDSCYKMAKLQLGKLLYIDQVEVPQDESVFKHYIKQRDIDAEDFDLVEVNELRRHVKIFLKREIRKQREDTKQERLREKTKSKLNTLKEDGKTLKINDMMFSKAGVDYHGQMLSINSSKVTGSPMEFWVHNMVSNLTRYQSLKDIYFDTMITSFAAGIQNIAERGFDVGGRIGDVSFTVRSVTSTNVRGITSTRWYLNDRRINWKELPDILERGICFENQIDFDNFIKSVSACSLYFHKFLQRGIDINVRDDFDSTNVTLKFPLERRKGKMYLVLDNNEFHVKNTHKIINLRKKYSMMEVVTALLDGSVVRDVTADDIKDIIQDGKQAYVDAIEKSKKLLTETEELYDITADDHRVGEDTKFGYKIEGKMRTYFLEKNYESEDKNSCGVYDYNTGQYICIVDKSTSQVGMDKLVNRIFALHNDSLVAQHINTLTTGN